jgi:hypothetical protein
LLTGRVDNTQYVDDLALYKISSGSLFITGKLNVLLQSTDKNDRKIRSIFEKLLLHVFRTQYPCGLNHIHIKSY